MAVTGTNSANKNMRMEVKELLVDGEPVGTVPTATTSTAGIVKQSATQANSAASDVAGLVTDFNALLAKLKAAGLMA